VCRLPQDAVVEAAHGIVQLSIHRRPVRHPG
jgi:hypothetical protein